MANFYHNRLFEDDYTRNLANSEPSCTSIIATVSTSFPNFLCSNRRHPPSQLSECSANAPIIPTVLEMLVILGVILLFARGEFAITMTIKKHVRTIKAESVHRFYKPDYQVRAFSAFLTRKLTSLATLQSVNDENVGENLDCTRDSLLALVDQSGDHQTPGSSGLHHFTFEPAGASLDDILLQYQYQQQ